MKEKKLYVILGPTGVGKTKLSIELAEHLNTEIVSADSRQMYKDIYIGTAAPTKEEKDRVKHHFVDFLQLEDYYSAAKFEEEAIRKIQEIHKTKDNVVLSGGSMMYIDAVCNGIDDIPTVDELTRKTILDRYEQEGLTPLLAELRLLDPEYYNIVDQKNYKRVLHALEICYMTGETFTSFRTNTKKERPFTIVKIGLHRDREELYERINKRVDMMMEEGLEEEARSVYHLREYNSLNTVGYKELFNYFDGTWTKEFAIEKIKQNSRIYSKKQMTWFKRDKEIKWYNPEDIDITSLTL